MKALKRPFFFIFILFIIIGGVVGLFKLNIGEHLGETIPGSAQAGTASWIESQKQQIAFAITLEPQESPEMIESMAEALLALIQETTGDAVADLMYRSDLDPDAFAKYFYEHLPLYLDPQDYAQIARMLSPDQLRETLVVNKQKLLSPEGFGVKKWLIDDPLHLLPLALHKVQALQNKAVTNSEGLMLSDDGRQLYLTGRVLHDISSSQQNARLADQLRDLQIQWSNTHPDHALSYFGTFLIADANARQIKKDVVVTLSIASAFIIFLLLYYYRKVYILLLFLLPGAFGILFAIGAIYLIQGHLSGLALGASAVIFGIVADYSFHFFAQFMQSKNALKTRRQIFLPLTASAVTTIVAFMSLLFAQSQTLHDFGLLTSLSLSGTLFFVLTALPYLLQPIEKTFQFERDNLLDRWMEKVAIQDKRTSPWMLRLILILTVFFAYFAPDASFEDDMGKLNYYPESLKKNEVSLQNINPDLEKRLIIVSSHTDSSEVIRINHALYEQILLLNDSGGTRSPSSLAAFLPPVDLQQERIAAWDTFWAERKSIVKEQLIQIGQEVGFSPDAFHAFYDLLDTAPTPLQSNALIDQSEMLKKLVLQQGDQINLITSVICKKDQLDVIKKTLEKMDHIVIVDEASLVAQLIEAVRADFNYLLLFASMAVLIAMLIIYGSLELTVISFLPMVISWVWILGLSALLDIKFNFVNIIIATFIFGLGDDFSIFITDGLLERHKTGKRVLGHYQTGILLSALSTIVGTGVLIFAAHPALRSIAALSVMGIVIIAFVAFFVQPILFRFFITARTEKRKPPMTFFGIFLATFNYIMFAMGSLFSVLVSIPVRWLPFVSVSYKKIWLHRLIQMVAKVQLAMIFNVKKRDFGMENLDFNRPSILIANHVSFIDILTLLRLHPKLVLMINEWVYHSPLFGSLIRYVDFLPAFEGMENNEEKVKSLLADGYSVGIFPEGTRSKSGQIGRFHKGAFFLAKKLKVDITPILLHGFEYTLPTKDYFLKNGYNDLTVLPRWRWDDPELGQDYRAMTKLASKRFKQAHVTHFFNPDKAVHAFDPLLGMYRYKGPVTEWYFRIKWKYEMANYEKYSQLIGPGPKKIYDLGCGMGYLSHFLLFRAPERTIIGVDYDEEKVALAANSYLTNDHISFEAEDITQVKPVMADAIILADVLHYLSEADQLAVLDHCREGLYENGILLIRDGLSGDDEKHQWTKNSEKWSTQIIKFNKTIGELNFFTREFLENWAVGNGFNVAIEQQSAKSSNVLFVLTKSSGT